MADDKVIALRPTLVGDGAEIACDQVLGAAAGVYVQVVVVGFDKNGEIDMRSSHGSRDALWILERARLHLLTETE